MSACGAVYETIYLTAKESPGTKCLWTMVDSPTIPWHDANKLDKYRIRNTRQHFANDLDYFHLLLFPPKEI